MQTLTCFDLAVVVDMFDFFEGDGLILRRDWNNETPLFY